ncbi:MAG: hypothetical protein ACRC7N_02265 [Clostridium sp.]
MRREFLEFFQSVDKKIVSYDNILNFTFFIKNKSNEYISNILFRQEINIVHNKIFISATKNNGDHSITVEDSHVNLGELCPGEVMEIQINTVIDKAFKEILKSVGELTYVAGSELIEKEESNEEWVTFKGADFQEDGELKLYFDREYATIDDEIQVGIDIENKGNLTGEKVFLGDIIPEDCNYVENSLTINDSKLDFSGHVDSISIGRISLFQRISVKYKIRINREKNNDILRHRVTLKYENIIDEGEVAQKIIKSNEEILKIKLVKFDNFIKYANVKEATIGDRITFYIEGKNNGNLKLYDVILKDTINEVFKLVKDSTIVNGVKAYNTNFDKGILLESLNVGEKFSISYDVIVCDFLKEQIKRSQLRFKFECEEDMDYISKVIESSECSLKIKAPEIKSSKKFCNKRAGFLGDEVTTTILIENTGNLKCENLLVADKIPEYLSFIPNTLYINGEKIYSSDIGEISLKSIEGNSRVEISYRASICDIPKYNRNDNRVKVYYNYKVLSREYTKEEIFYGEDIVVNGAIIKKNSIEKTVDRLYGIIGDEVTYTVSFKNEGNFSCERVYIKEEENISLEFIDNSLNINGEEKPYNIFKGFLYGELNGNQRVNLTFRCKIISIPYSSVLQGFTHIEYEYRNENGLGRVKREVTAKSEEVIVKSAIIDNELGIFTKDAATSNVMVNDKVPIRIHLRNMGNTDAYNVVVKDEVINGLEVIEDSFTINSVKEKYTGALINIGNLKVNEEREILYFAKIKKDIENSVCSKARVEYCFYGNDGGTLISAKGKSNKFTLSVFNPSLVITESVNKDSFEVGEILNYNVYLTNNGNIDLKDISLTLNIGDIEGLTLNELSINRRIIRGATLNSEIHVGNIDKNESLSLCMKIELNKLLMKNTLFLKPKINGAYEGIDKVKTKVTFDTDGKEVCISLNKILVQKASSNCAYLKGDLVNYLITVRNDGTNTSENVVVYDDIIGEGFVEDSLTINGYPVLESFVSGIPVGALKQGECVYIRYSAIYGNEYLPLEAVSVVRVTAEFYDAKYGYMKKEFYSDELRIILSKASLNIVKTSDKRVVAYGEEINFITTIENNGTIPLINLTLKENVSIGFEPVGSSIFVNGSKVIKGDCIKGFPLPAIKPREFLEVSTKYIYKNYKRTRKLFTDSVVEYDFSLEGVKEKYTLEGKSNRILLEGEIATFKNITIDHDILLCEDDVWVQEITDVIVVPKITKSYVVKTIKNTSFGNENLTGYKLIIRGVLEEKVEYIAGTEQESIHMIIHEERFSTSIILPEQHEINENVNINSLVHDVFSKVIDENKIQISVNLTVEGLI